MQNQQKITLVIMAAGIGSRYGGVKQLDPVGPNGELIISYSVYDAIRAGYDKILIVLREDIKEDFREVVGDRLQKLCEANGVELAFAYQDLRDLPDGVEFPEGRTKPWGTCQALLACKGQIEGPFGVINSDDYYDLEALSAIYNHLKDSNPTNPEAQCMVGYQLLNTLSKSGGVTRGICKADANGSLITIKETYDLKETADGQVSFHNKNGESGLVPTDSVVSMNIWGFMPEMLTWMEEGFIDFFKEDHGDGIMEDEFLIPFFVGELLAKKKVSVQVLPTESVWYGVTYKEDHGAIVAAIQSMIDEGRYPENLYQE